MSGSTATRASAPTPKKEAPVANKSRQINPVYKVIGPQVRHDMALVGYRIDNSRQIDSNHPHLEVVDMSFVGGKKAVRTFQVDPILGRYCPDVTWIVDEKEFVVHSTDDGPTVSLITDGGEQEMEVEDDGEKVAIYRRTGNGKRKQVAVADVSKLYVEIGWELTAPVLVYGDALRTLGNPGTCRFRPIEGKKYTMCVAYEYAEVAIGRGPKVKRRFAKAFPLYPEDLTAEEYTPAPDDREPMKWRLVFYPVLLGRGEHKHIVPLTIDAASSKRVMLDRAFELEQDEWGKTIPCLVREGRRDLNAIPDRRVMGSEKDKATFTAFEQSAESAMEAFEAEQIDLEDDEFVHGGVKLKVFDALKKYKITEDSTRRQVEGARKRMERELHPDTNKQLKAYRDASVTPPDSLVKSINESVGLFRAAFNRLLTLLTEREELAAKAGEDIDPNDPDLLQAEGEEGGM